MEMPSILKTETSKEGSLIIPPSIVHMYSVTVIHTKNQWCSWLNKHKNATWPFPNYVTLAWGKIPDFPAFCTVSNRKLGRAWKQGYIMLKVSYLKLEINVMRQKYRKVKRPAVTGSQTQDTSGLSCQCSATELRQPDNHQPLQSSICAAQVAAGLFHFPLFLPHNIQISGLRQLAFRHSNTHEVT